VTGNGRAEPQAESRASLLHRLGASRRHAKFAGVYSIGFRVLAPLTPKGTGHDLKRERFQASKSVRVRTWECRIEYSLGGRRRSNRASQSDPRPTSHLASLTGKGGCPAGLDESRELEADCEAAFPWFSPREGGLSVFRAPFARLARRGLKPSWS
jgi:hypothetical protein